MISWEEIHDGLNIQSEGSSLPLTILGWACDSVQQILVLSGGSMLVHQGLPSEGCFQVVFHFSFYREHSGAL